MRMDVYVYTSCIIISRRKLYHGGVSAGPQTRLRSHGICKHLSHKTQQNHDAPLSRLAATNSNGIVGGCLSRVRLVTCPVTGRNHFSAKLGQM